MSQQIPNNITVEPWEKWKLFVFRTGFIFLLLLTVPSDGGYYKKLLSFGFHFQDFFQLTRYPPAILHLSNWGWASYAGWLLALIIAIAGALVWQAIDKKTSNYEQLYYWARVVLRYRLALGIIAYGTLLLVPVQLPFPALGDLHTAYGDFLPWKIYYHSTAVAAAGYRQTIGAVEILGGLLLLYRRTVPLGAIIISFVLVNVVLANFAYQLGDHLYSSYLLLLALVLLANDIPRLYFLLVKGTRTVAEKFTPSFTYEIRLFRNGARVIYAAFILVFMALTLSSYVGSNWPYPDTPGLKNAAGFYNVSSFRLNGTVHPYSLTDSVRWKDVVFEKWNVLSVRTNYPVQPNLTSPSITFQTGDAGNYESIGNGGRTFYTYKQSGSAISLVNDNDRNDVLDLSLSRPNDSTIILAGKNKQGDSLLVALDKIDKKYLLNKGRRKPVSVY